MSRLPPNTVMYNRDFVLFGGVNCAIYLSTLLYHYHEWSVSGGWMLLNVEMIQRITGLVLDDQRVARRALCERGVLREGMAFDDPALWIDIAKLDELIAGNRA